MENTKKTKAGFVYILGNSELPDIIKLGEATNPEERAITLSKQTGAIGKYTVIWKHKVDDDNQAVEKALHYKFREYSVDKEYFRINKKIAIKVASQFVKDIKPLKNSKVKQYKVLKTNGAKHGVQTASKSLWNEVLRSDVPVFIKEAIKLCLKEGKIGQPQYRRFSAIRNEAFINLGKADMYILNEHIRVVITNRYIRHVKAILHYRIGKEVKITKWKDGISFFIRSPREFKALAKWFDLGANNPKQKNMLQEQIAIRSSYRE